jgi:prepilin-type N-terminal cleavage/methylation domain-containing protein
MKGDVAMQGRLCHQGGFSLPEMLLAVMVLGIAAAVIMPRYVDFTDCYRLDAAAQRVAADLRGARQFARSRAADCAVAFSLESNSYELVGYRDPDRPGEPYVVALGRSPYSATIASVVLEPSRAERRLTFDMYGAPDASAIITLVNSSGERLVRVHPLSGVITVE